MDQNTVPILLGLVVIALGIAWWNFRKRRGSPTSSQQTEQPVSSSLAVSNPLLSTGPKKKKRNVSDEAGSGRDRNRNLQTTIEETGSFSSDAISTHEPRDPPKKQKYRKKKVDRQNSSAVKPTFTFGSPPSNSSNPSARNKVDSKSGINSNIQSNEDSRSPSEELDSSANPGKSPETISPAALPSAGIPSTRIVNASQIRVRETNQKKPTDKIKKPKPAVAGFSKYERHTEHPRRHQSKVVSEMENGRTIAANTEHRRDDRDADFNSSTFVAASTDASTAPRTLKDFIKR